MRTYNQDDDDKRRRRREGGGGLVILIGLLSGLGLAAFIMTLVFHSQDGARTSALAREAAINNSHLQMDLWTLRSQVVELMQGNETLIRNGTVTWGIAQEPLPGDGFWNYAGQTCSEFTTVGGWQMVNGGTGYRVGDLIVGQTFGNSYPTPGASFAYAPVLRVTQVDGLTGAVMAFDTLTTGCGNVVFQSLTDTYSTLSVVGTGFTMKIIGGTVVINPNTFRQYPTPPGRLSDGLQEARYELRNVQLGGANFLLLYLFPPELPLRVAVRQPADNPVVSVMIETYHFEPDVPELTNPIVFDAGFPVWPLTPHNFAALNLTDDSNCVALSVCKENAFAYPPLNSLTPALQMGGYQDADNHLRNALIFYYHTSDVGFDFVTHQAQFTLNYPLMLVLNAA